MKICVIGAGLSGLVTIKEVKEESHNVVCYEKSSRCGGVFGLHDGKSAGYDEGHLTVSNYFMAFSSLKPEEAERRYWTWGEYNSYLRQFIKKFDLLDHITFNAEVREIERTTDGKWLVRTVVGAEDRAEIFDAVAVCTGRYRVPFMPEINGLSDFGGEIWHSFDYKNAAPFEGKRVVCVGFGESSADICHQVAQVAQTTTLVMRQPPFVLPRSLKHFIGVDVTNDALTCRYIESMVSETSPLGQAIFHAYSLIAPHQFQFMNAPEISFLRQWGQMGNHVFGKFPVKNDIFVRDILDGKLEFNLFGIETVGEDYVICGDGSRIDADVLIFNTGYLNDFSFFTNAPEIKEVESNMRKLYKHMLHPTYGSSLAFIGFVRPESGNLPTCAELQARYFARLCSGKAQLPDQKTLEDVAQAEGQQEEASYYLKSYLTESVRYYPYTEGLAKLIGCEPHLPLLNPKLLLKYYFGSAVPNWFRLSGPGSNAEEAKQVIMQLPIVIPVPVIVSIGIIKSFMVLASGLDRLTFKKISKWLAQRQPTPQAFLRRELKQKQLNRSERLRTLCPDSISWHNLKYKLHKQFHLPPKTIKPDLTVGQLFDLCAEKVHAKPLEHKVFA